MSIWSKLFGKREAPEPKVVRVDISAPDLIRQSLYDAQIENVEDVMEVLGYQRQSEEVSEMTKRESDRRLEPVDALFVPASLFADAVTHATVLPVALLAQQSNGVEVNGETMDMGAIFEALEEYVARNRAMVMSVLAGLVDLGLIEVKADLVGIHGPGCTCGEDDDDWDDDDWDEDDDE